MGRLYRDYQDDDDPRTDEEIREAADAAFKRGVDAINALHREIGYVLSVPDFHITTRFDDERESRELSR